MGSNISLTTNSNEFSTAGSNAVPTADLTEGSTTVSAADLTEGSSADSNANLTEDSSGVSTEDSSGVSAADSNADSNAGSSAVLPKYSDNAEQFRALSEYFGKMSRMNVSGAPENLEIFALYGKVQNKANLDLIKLVIIIGMINSSGGIEYVPIYTFTILDSKPSKLMFRFSDDGGFSLDLFAGQGSMERNVRSVKCESGDYAIRHHVFFSFCRVSESPVDPVAPVCLVSPLAQPAQLDLLVQSAQLDPLEFSQLLTLDVCSGDDWLRLSLLHLVQWDMSTLRGLNHFSEKVFTVSSINLLSDNCSTLTQLNLVCGSGSATVCANGRVELFLDKNLESVVPQNSSLSCCAPGLEDQHTKCPDVKQKQPFDFSKMTDDEFTKELQQMSKVWCEEKDTSKKEDILSQMKEIRKDFNKFKETRKSTKQ